MRLGQRTHNQQQRGKNPFHVAHSFTPTISVAPSGATVIFYQHPGLTPWATKCRPFGAVLSHGGKIVVSKKNVNRAKYALDIVLAAGGKHVNDMRFLNSSSLMFNTSADDEAVAATHFKGLVTTGDLQMASHHIDELVVRVAMPLSDPAFFHVVLCQK